MHIISVSDYREQARKKIPHFLFEYIDGGSVSESTLRANRRDLEQVSLRQRVLKDVRNINTELDLFGTTYSMPVVLGPVGIAGLNARRGEVQAARAAEENNVPFAMSTVSLCSVEEVAGSVRDPMWFQLYMAKDRVFLKELLKRVQNTGCEILLLTADLPVVGTRYRDVRSGLTRCDGLPCQLWRLLQILARPSWVWDVGIMGGPHNLGNLVPLMGSDAGLKDFLAWTDENFDPSATWDDISFVRENWSGKIIVKGLLDPEDASQAIKCGVDGIVVSNHGGRQLDGAPSTAKALPRIADRVAGTVPILVDGGISSGTDIIRMLALGADAVLIGRAWVYALAAAGHRGVNQVLHLLKEELRIAMALTGHTKPSMIDRNTLIDNH